jgi:hypothetical protein
VFPCLHSTIKLLFRAPDAAAAAKDNLEQNV